MERNDGCRLVHKGSCRTGIDLEARLLRGCRGYRRLQGGQEAHCAHRLGHHRIEGSLEPGGMLGGLCGGFLTGGTPLVRVFYGRIQVLFSLIGHDLASGKLMAQPLRVLLREHGRIKGTTAVLRFGFG